LWCHGVCIGRLWSVTPLDPETSELLMILLPFRSRTFFLAALSLVMTCSACAEEFVWATGRVTDVGGRPVPNATVAVYDAKNRVVDYVRTDQNGEYTITIPRSALNLTRRKGGFLHTVSRSVNSLVGFGGNLASGPLKAGLRAASSLATTSDPWTKAGIGAAVGIASSIVDIVTGTGMRRGSLKRTSPGVLAIKVVSDRHNDAVALGRVYWMQEEVYSANGRNERAIVAWLDPVRLTDAATPGASSIGSDYLTFTEARITPGIVERGGEVTISVTFRKPPEPRTPVVLVARNSRTGKMFGLDPVGGDRYECRFVVDKGHPLNDQVITVLAYAEQDVRPGRNPAAERAIERAGLWDPKRPFLYNPLLIASRNRVELTLTVVDLAKR